MAEKEHNVLDYENIEQMIVNRNIESRVKEAFRRMDKYVFNA